MEEGIQIACKYFTEKVWKSADFGVCRESWNQAPMETKEWLYLELGEHACVTLVTVWRITTSCNNAGYMKWDVRSRCGELSFRWHRWGRAHEHSRGQGEMGWGYRGREHSFQALKQVCMTGWGPGSWWQMSWEKMQGQLFLRVSASSSTLSPFLRN